MEGGAFMDAYEILGVKRGVDREELKRAYHDRAKEHHPDRYTDPAEQEAAQQRMVKLNVAYEKVWKEAGEPVFRFSELPLDQVVTLVRRLIDQGQLQGALLQLSRAQEKDARWYSLQGEILMAFREYDTAHQSFREAVRREPDDMDYRRQALEAAVQVKRRKHLPVRLRDSIGSMLLGRKRK